MSRKPGKIVGRADLAVIMAVTPQTVDAWVRKGCPVVTRGGRGKQYEFDTGQIIRWREELAKTDALSDESIDIAELRRRKMAAEVALAELELAEAKAEVVPLSELELSLSRIFAEVKANMRALPRRVVPRLIRETDEVRFKTILLEEIDSVLTALSDATVLTVESPDE